MKKILIVFLFLVTGLSYGQIYPGSNFNLNSAIPLDNTMYFADLAAINAFLYPFKGKLAFANDTKLWYEYDGSTWKLSSLSFWNMTWGIPPGPPANPNLLYYDGTDPDRVGIGTSTPSYELDIVGSTNTSPISGELSSGYRIGGNYVFRVHNTTNFFIGNSGGSDALIADNLMIGDGAGSAMSGAVCQRNIGIGTNALKNVTGFGNLGVGYSSLQNLTSGGYNTGIGYGALSSVTIGAGNLSIGYGSGGNITEGGGNVLIGRGSGLSMLKDAENVGIGYNALQGSAGSYSWLEACRDAANLLKIEFNEHVSSCCAITDAHISLDDLITTADATTDFILIVDLTYELLVDYAWHDRDVGLVTPIYHYATDVRHSLVTANKPTNIVELSNALIDLHAKLDLHVPENVAHNGITTSLQAVVDPTGNINMGLTAIGTNALRNLQSNNQNMIGIGYNVGAGYSSKNLYNSIWIGNTTGGGRQTGPTTWVGSKQILIGNSLSGKQDYYTEDYAFAIDYGYHGGTEPYVYGVMEKVGAQDRWIKFPGTNVYIQDSLFILSDSLVSGDTTYIFNDGTDTQIKGDISSSQSIKIGYKNPLTVNNSTGQVTFNNTLISNYSLSVPSDSSYRVDKQKFITRGYNASGSNLAFGVGALANAGWATKVDNIFIGEDAGLSISSGATLTGDIAIGRNALYSHSTQGYSIAIGTDALKHSTTGYDNIAIGHKCTSGNAVSKFTGSENTTVGYHAYKEPLIGTNNSFYGHQAAENKTIGNYNTAVGSGALHGGGLNNNTTLGANTGLLIDIGSGNVLIGYNVGATAHHGLNDTLMIDNSSTTRPLICGDFATNELTIWGSLKISDKTAVSSQDSVLFREGNKVKYGLTDPIENNDITWTGNHIFNNAVNYNGLYNACYSADVVDDGTITTFSGSAISGWGTISGGDNEEWSQFRFASDGTITLINNTGNVDDADTDTDLCIYDAGANGFIIKNRLGGTKKIRYEIWYSAQ